MAKPEWGSKHTCSHCSAVFYDMQQNPILCPACGKTHEPETLLKARRGSRASVEAAKKAAEKPAKPAVEEEEEDLEIEDSDDLVEIDDDDDALIDDDDLDEDDDDLRDVPAKTDSDDKDT